MLKAFTVLRPAGVALLVVAFLLLYYPSFRSLTEYWAANDMYSYGYLVPLISGYLIWLRRERLRATPVAPAYGVGGFVLVLGLVMLVVGRASSTNLVEWLSLPVAVCGVCLLVLGSRVTQAMAFPLAYLFAMIPFWDFLTVRLHPPFQLYSAMLGVGALRLFDVPVIREGVFIHLPNLTLEVADLCSGVNQLVAILCIGVPVTHIHVKRWSRRVFIVAMAVLIALLSNGVRVALISLYVYYGMREADGDVHGPYSLLRTMVISGVGFLVLFWLISRFADPVPPDGSGTGVPAPDGMRRRVTLPALAAACAILVGTVAFEHWHEDTRVPPNAALVGFPATVGRWRFLGSTSVSPSVQAVGFDHTLSRRYALPDGTELELLVGYFESQRQGHELAGFQLAQLLAIETGPFTLDLSPNVRVKDFVTRVKGVPHHATYWYIVNGRIAVSDYQAKWWTTWDSLTRRRSTGGIVMVKARMRPEESLETSRSKVRDFVEALLPASRLAANGSSGS